MRRDLPAARRVIESGERDALSETCSNSGGICHLWQIKRKMPSWQIKRRIPSCATAPGSVAQDGILREESQRPSALVQYYLLRGFEAINSSISPAAPSQAGLPRRKVDPEPVRAPIRSRTRPPRAPARRACGGLTALPLRISKRSAWPLASKVPTLAAVFAS